MTIEIRVTVVRMETNEAENYKQVAFADHDGDPTAYVIMQRAIEPDAQDGELGLDGCYIETSDPGVCGYDLCRRVVMGHRSVRIQLKPVRGIQPDDVLLDLTEAAYSEVELKTYLTFVAGDILENGCA